jgi:hypothetical protein
MKDKIIENLKSPDELERLYRKDAKVFAAAFCEIPPETIGGVYGFWNARIRYDEKGSSEEKRARLGKQVSVQMIVLLAIVGGTIAKIPDIFHIKDGFFYPRFISFALFPILSAYFILRTEINKRIAGAVGLVFLAAGFYMRFLPDLQKSDTILLSCMHVPFFLWTISGLAFVAAQFRNIERRIL